jgi:hypothetical protein
MPGLEFDALELRYDVRTAQLSYRPDLLDDLLAWNEAEADGEPASAAMYELLVACYAHWRSEGGCGNWAMEASLAAEKPVQMVRLAPLYPSLLARVQRWLGLLDAAADICETA